jgi:hypothetical protein
MKRALLTFAAIALITATMDARAGATAPTFVTITAVDARSDGTFLVWFTPAATGSPACANAASNAMTGTTTTAGGKAVLAQALSMFLSGKRVFVDGMNVCNEYPGYESAYRIYGSN